MLSGCRRLASEHALLLVSTGYGVLETGGVGRVTSDGDVNVLLPQDSYTLTNIVGTIALNLQTARIVAVRNLLNHSQITSEVIELGLYIGETVNTADDLSSVLTKTVQDHAKGLLAHLVGHLSNLDGTLGSSEALVTSQESEALCLLTEQTSGEVTVTDTYLTIVGY